ncbi:MAG: PilZ domain-containing protein [Bdellovibrionales bacterium]|jgi:hypothetical protein|nr:PilZ domain-containing protein [Bdellovibrionales bacterium]
MFGSLFSSNNARALAILRSIQFGERRPDALSISLAHSASDYVKAANLIYHSYQRRGIPFTDESEMRLLPQILTPNASVIIAKSGDQVVGTATVVGKNPLGFPMSDTMTDEEQAALFNATEGPSVEIAALAVQDAYAGKPGALYLPMAGYLIHYCRHYLNTTYIAAAIQPRLLDFYSAVFGAKPTCESLRKKPRKYKTLGDLDAIPIWTKTSELSKHVESFVNQDPKLQPLYDVLFNEPSNNPLYVYPSREKQRSFDQPKPASVIEELFVKRTDILKKIDDVKRAQVQAMYPNSDEYRWIFHVDPGLNLRKATRFNVNLKTVVVQPCDPEHAPLRQGQILDVSSSGVRLQLAANQAPLKVDQPIHLTLTVSESTETLLKGRIVRTLPDNKGYGVEITEGDGIFRDYIRWLRQT